MTDLQDTTDPEDPTDPEDTTYPELAKYHRHQGESCLAAHQLQLRKVTNLVFLLLEEASISSERRKSFVIFMMVFFLPFFEGFFGLPGSGSTGPNLIRMKCRSRNPYRNSDPTACIYNI
jgi:hypothetical protein